MKIKCDCKESYKKDRCKKCGHIHYAIKNEGHYHRENDWLNDSLRKRK